MHIVFLFDKELNGHEVAIGMHMVFLFDKELNGHDKISKPGCLK